MTATKKGFGLVEALVALALAAIALGALAASTQTATRALRRTAARQAATAAALDRLESLRAGPRGSGNDLVPGGTHPVARVWRHSPGRGRPDLLAVEVECDGTRLALGSAAWP